jgi:hypothetical protein
MVVNTMENGIKAKIKNMEEVYKNGRKGQLILDILNLIKLMDKEN